MPNVRKKDSEQPSSILLTRLLANRPRALANVVEGMDIADACRRAGFGHGAVAALDCWEELRADKAAAQADNEEGSK